MKPPLPSALDRTLKEILAKALELQRTGLGNIQLVDERTGALAIVAQQGFGPDFLEHFRTVRLSDGSACGRAMRGKSST